ncbi:MAG: tetratricopeptide repeat protein [Sphingobacteriaceae bacterium]
MLSTIKKHFTEHTILWVALIATLLVYYKSLFFPYISWDDPEMIFKNKDVIRFKLSALFTDHYVGNYIPLTMLSHAIAWALFKGNVFGHHLLNLSLHLINGYLVYQLSLKLFKEKKIASLTVVLFLLHPLQIESVNWLSEFKTLGYTCFFLLGSLSYLNYTNTKLNKQLVYTALYFIASCLFKPSAVIFPLCLICIDLFIHQNFQWRYVINKIPFLFISLLFGLINLKTQAADQFINYAHSFPFYERITNAGLALVKYTQLVLAPFNLSVIYPFPEKTINGILLGAFAVITILVAIFMLNKKQLFTPLAIILFILFNLILVLQFVPFGEVLYADRYMYLPLVGFAWLLAFLISKFKLNEFIIPSVLIAALGTTTFMRSDKWKNSITLYEDIIKKYPDNFLALNSLGVENMMKNNDDKAYLYFNRATTVAPNNYKGYYNRGLLLLKNNNPKKAIEEFNKVFSLYDYSKAYVARASAFYALMKYTEARTDATIALRKDRFNHKAMFVLGNCDNDENDLANAITFYNRAIELNNEEPDYYFKRSIAFGKQQKFTDCMNDLNTCLNLNPNYVEAYYWRGVAKVNLKQNPCEDFRRAAENNYTPAKEAFVKTCY